MSDTPPPPSGLPMPGPQPAPPTVDFRPLLTISDWLTDTTRSLVKGFGDFFAVLTITALVSTILSAPLLWVSSEDAVFTRDDDGNFTSVEGLSTAQGFMIAGGVLIALTSQILLFTAATHHIDRVRAGDLPVWRETMGALLARGPRVIGVVLQVLIAAFLILIISGLLGGLGLGALAGIVALAAIVLLWVRSAVASTHAALNGPGPSVKHSFAWTKGLALPLLGRHVLLATICVGLLFTASIFSAPFQSLSGATASTDGDLVLREIIGPSVSAFAAVQFINALASGVTAALWASGMLSLYRGVPPER